MRYALICVVALCAWLPLASAPSPARAQAADPPAADAAVQGVVNVNQATAEQLQLLPGVGPARAKAILDYREANGAFGQVEELMSVSGIGTRALERLRPYVVLEGKTTARPRGR